MRSFIVMGHQVIELSSIERILKDIDSIQRNICLIVCMFKRKFCFSTASGGLGACLEPPGPPT